MLHLGKSWIIFVRALLKGNAISDFASRSTLERMLQDLPFQLIAKVTVGPLRLLKMQTR